MAFLNPTGLGITPPTDLNSGAMRCRLRSATCAAAVDPGGKAEDRWRAARAGGRGCRRRVEGTRIGGRTKS